MNKFILTIALVFGFAITASATTMTFEINDRPENHGFTTTNAGYINGTTYMAGSGYDNGTISPDYVMYSGSGHPMSLTNNNNTFTFNDVYMTAAWNYNLEIEVEGITPGTTPDYSTTFTLSLDAPTLMSFDWVGLSSITFLSSGGTAGQWGNGLQIVFDDLRFNEPVGSSPVPEPATILLFGSGLVGLATRLRRRNTKK